MENFEEFIAEYRKNVKAVLVRTMLKCIKEIDKDLFDAGICWMVSDNIRYLLALDPEEPSRVVDPRTWQELSQNRLVIVAQDLEKDDHWFALISDQERVHLVEHSPKGKNFSETFLRKGLVELLVAIKKGEVPERFYGLKGDHVFSLLSFDRKPMRKERIIEFLSSQD